MSRRFSTPGILIPGVPYHRDLVPVTYTSMHRCTRHTHEADEQAAVHFISTVEEDCETTEENMEVETCEEVETELWNEVYLKRRGGISEREQTILK